MKQDKLPYIDPSQPDIFNVIIATVARVRKERQSYEYMQAEKRREESAAALRKLKEGEAKAEAYREEQERRRAENDTGPTSLLVHDGRTSAPSSTD